MGAYDVMDRGIATAATRRLGTPALGFGLSTDLQINLQTPTDNIEMAWHLGWRRWSLGMLTNLAGAGNIIRFQLRNPDPPNRVIIVLEQIQFQPIATSDTWQIGVVGIGPGINDLTNLVTGMSPNDGRNAAPLGTASKSQLIVSWQGQVQTIPRAPGYIHEWVAQGNNTAGGSGIISPMQNMPVVLLPGNALFGENNAQNNQVLMNAVWRERMLNDQEGSL